VDAPTAAGGRESAVTRAVVAAVAGVPHHRDDATMTLVGVIVGISESPTAVAAMTTTVMVAAVTAVPWLTVATEALGTTVATQPHATTTLLEAPSTAVVRGALPLVDTHLLPGAAALRRLAVVTTAVATAATAVVAAAVLSICARLCLGSGRSEPRSKRPSTPSR